MIGSAIGMAALTPATATATPVDPTVSADRVAVYVCHLGADATLCERMTGDMVFGVEEDSPAFDCRIHGNRVCGEGAVLPDGRVALAGEYRTVVLRG